MCIILLYIYMFQKIPISENIKEKTKLRISPPLEYLLRSTNFFDMDEITL